jgi:predicted O-linked N-acetylglucosamine transferase (SPINDLY family)
MNALTQTLNQAVELHRQGDLARAERLYLQLLAARPDHFDALQMLGFLRYEQGRHLEALSSIGAALKANPNSPTGLLNYAVVLDTLRRHEEALGYYDRALAIKPDYTEALFNRGIALRNLRRPAEALASFDQVLAIRPDDADAHNHRGSALRDLKRPAEAVAGYDRALALRPGDAEFLNNRGNALRDLNRLAEALASYDQALASRPDDAGALNDRGSALRSLRRPAEAVASYDKALAIKPDYVEALNNRGNALQDLQRSAEALASFERALLIKPDFAGALYNCGITLRTLNRLAEALASFDKAIAAMPDHRYAFSGLAESALAACDWTRTAALAGELEHHLAERKVVLSPFTLLGYEVDPQRQLECARRYVGDQVSSSVQPLWNRATGHHGKIRIAYLSSDFREHAVAWLSAGLFELHDRTRFEVVGISHGPDDGSEMRTRLMRAFDQFHDVRTMSDRDAAGLLNELHIDIAVDLNGHTQGSRPGILALHPAPIQVSYLGYPGTMGADFVDYVVADKTVLPFDQQPFYTERIIHLPDCYQVNDSRREIAADTPSRREAGLPDEGFAFCCFNNSFKITPLVFDIWMRLLRTVEGSVLWLSAANNEAMHNLSGQARARGVDPGRLIFAPKLAQLKDHLARHRLADLFVDTLPFNAHTTASDALWAGLPVLTCRGASFPGRVAASLLSAAGLPELVTRDLGEYEALALRLAADAPLLRGFRRRLEQNGATCPLFDTDRFRRHIESAYTTMWELQRRGEGPRSFSVEPAR